MLLSARKMQLSRTCWNFREKAENFHPKFRKIESISDNTVYKFSSETSSGDVERSFDDHVDAFHGKANIFPFSFQIWFGGKFSQGKHIIPQIVRLDTKTAVLTSCRWSFPGCLQIGPSNSKNRNSFFFKALFSLKMFLWTRKTPFWKTCRKIFATLQKLLQLIFRNVEKSKFTKIICGEIVFLDKRFIVSTTTLQKEVEFPTKFNVFHLRPETVRRRFLSSKKHNCSNCLFEHVKGSFYALTEKYREWSETSLLKKPNF